jgi:STE24 endopeptidase
MTIQNLSITFITFFTLKTLAQLYLNWRNLKHIQKKCKRSPCTVSEDISIEDHQKAATYSVVKIKFEQFSMIFHSLLFLAWFPFGGLNWLNDFVSKL